LARADLVEAMDPSVVAESEIRDAHATFHFVRPLEAPRPKRAGESGRASPKTLAGVAAVGALGVIDPTYIPIAVAGVIMAKPAKHVGGWLYERWAVSVLDRVARQGADVGTELRERAIAAVDHTKRLIGEWEAQTTEALTHMSRAPLGVGRRHAAAVRTLSEIVPFSLAAPMAEAAGLLGGGSSTPVAPSEARAYFTRFHLAAEGILDRAALTPEEQRIVDLYQGLRNRIVESAAAMGVEMRLRDGTWAPVQPDPARQRMLRRWTPEGIDVLRNAFD